MIEVLRRAVRWFDDASGESEYRRRSLQYLNDLEERTHFKQWEDDFDQGTRWRVESLNFSLGRIACGRTVQE